MAIALQLKDQYADDKCIYLECKNVEKALLRYVQDILEDKYKEAIIDTYTNLINDDILTFLEYLFYNYEKVSSKEVVQKRSRSYVYNIASL